MSTSTALETLASARLIADYAERLGVERSPTTPRAENSHLGAVLADSVLQAGVNYTAVVRVRINRILTIYPDAATLSGLKAVIRDRSTSDFLQWTHPTKISRFVLLMAFFDNEAIENTIDLKRWLSLNKARDKLLSLNGVGPKTYDYMCCLIGIDCIAVDRHIKTFVREAGIPLEDYDSLKTVVSCAADLLGLPRRDFDAWIWGMISQRTHSAFQYQLF